MWEPFPCLVMCGLHYVRCKSSYVAITCLPSELCGMRVHLHLSHLKQSELAV